MCHSLISDHASYSLSSNPCLLYGSFHRPGALQMLLDCNPHQPQPALAGADGRCSFATSERHQVVKDCSMKCVSLPLLPISVCSSDPVSISCFQLSVPPRALLPPQPPRLHRPSPSRLIHPRAATAILCVSEP